MRRWEENYEHNYELDQPKDHSYFRITPEFVWLCIAAVIFVYFYKIQRQNLDRAPDYGVRQPVISPTDPAEIARLRELDIRRAQVLAKRQEEHSKLSIESAESRQKRLIETLNKKLATIEGLNSASGTQNSAIESLKFKSRTFDPTTVKPKPRLANANSSEPQPSTSQSCRIASTEFLVTEYELE